MSQETGLIRAGFSVRQQWETKDRGWGGLEMNSSWLLGLFDSETCMLCTYNVLPDQSIGAVMGTVF